MLRKDSFQCARSLFAGGGGAKPLSRVVAFALLCATLAFTGCEHAASNDSGALTGTWKNVAGENGEYVTTIKITSNTINYVGSYEGKIVNSPDFEALYGVLIIQFTKYADNWGDEPSASSTNVGKYGALYWKELTPDSVYMADAYVNYVHTIFGTRDEAKKAFTNDDAVNTYVDWSITSPYTR
jgi:hypothetical protein